MGEDKEMRRVKLKYNEQWHKWFAWRPVIVNYNYGKVYVWFEYVNRKAILLENVFIAWVYKER